MVQWQTVLNMVISVKLLKNLGIYCPAEKLLVYQEGLNNKVCHLVNHVLLENTNFAL